MAHRRQAPTLPLRARRRRVPRLFAWASFIKLEHTLFSLPLLFAGTLLAASGLPQTATLGWILLAGTGARTLALALNRIIDRRLDALNPRTRSRELPSGRILLAEAWGIAAAGALLYVGGCVMLPPVCLLLSPVPVLVFVVYPYLKRFTAWAHFGVGLALALAPLGGYVAVRGNLANLEPALWLAAFTWLWVAGFDVIYATLDVEFDRTRKLYSLPARFGRRRALRAAAAIHGIACLALGVLYARFLGGPLSGALVVAVAVVLAVEHRLAQRVNLAFFQLNIVVGLLVLAALGAGVVG